MSGVAVGRVAALLLAVWPTLIQFTTVLASEVHFIALSLSAIAAWQVAVARGPRGGWPWLVLAGLILGAATYIRPIALLIPATLALAALLRFARPRGRTVLWPVTMAVLATVIVIAVVSPWSMRNERLFGEPVFMSTNFWPNFWMGNRAGTNGEYMPLPDWVDTMTETERSDALREIALAEVTASPAGFVWRTAWKAVRLHRGETIGVHWNHGVLGTGGLATGLKLLSAGYWFAVLAAGLAGLGLFAARAGLWVAITAPAFALWAYYTAIHAIIVVGDRYHMPAIPMIALFAGFAAVTLAGRGPWGATAGPDARSLPQAVQTAKTAKAR